MKLRSYQEDAVDSVFDYFKNNTEGNPLIGLPTGSGKSLVLAGFLERTFRQWPNQRVLMLTHVKELVAQNHDKLLCIWPNAPVGLHCASLRRRDIHNNIIFGSIGSVARKADQFGHVDLLWVDEADLISPTQSTMYQRFITALKEVNPYLRVVGMTATMWRTKGGLLTNAGGIFTDICYDATGIDRFNSFIEEGYLMPLVPPQTSFKLDVSGVGITGGEYNQHELQIAVDHYELTKQAIIEVIERGKDRRCYLIFCSGIEHSIHTARILNDMGIPTGCVHSGNKNNPLANAERDQILADFGSGKLRAVTNNAVLSVGYDNPRIDLVAFLKPMKSSRTWVQCLGRATRPNFAPGFDISTKQGRFDAIEAGGKKDALILDFTDNTETLGPINAPLIPSGKKRKKGEPLPAPSKLCPQCEIWTHAAARECIHCGYEFPPPELTMNEVASTKLLIATSVPEINPYVIEHVTYSCHTKRSNGSKSLKVTYFSGDKSFYEFVFIENEKMRRSSNIWWHTRTSIKLPSTVNNALELTNQLKTPTTIQVWENKTYPEIVKHSFDEFQYT